MAESVQAKAHRLRQSIKLLSEAAEVVIKEWEKEAQSPGASQKNYLDGSVVPSKELYDARQTGLGAVGVCVELLQEPQVRLMEMALQFNEARAMHIITEAKVADILDEGDHVKGVSLEKLSQKTGIKGQKLARLLRTLCSAHIFKEVSYDYFANNSVSQTLVDNEPLRSWILTMSWSIFTACDKLPDVVFDPVKTQSESPTDTAFQAGHNTDLPFFEWLEEPNVLPDGTTQPKRDLPLFGLAMLGGGRAQGPPLYLDFPWGSLGSATVVDVGGGVGGMSLDLAKLYPNLKFVIQDRPPVVKQAGDVWKRELPGAAESGRVKFVGHNFFNEQPIRGADIYHMRYIMHDWPDEQCVQILSALRPALEAHSRVLISDQVMLTTCPSPSSSFPSAPEPLPANYGFAHRFKHLRDLNMLVTLNGRERSPEDWRDLASRSGLKVERFWEARGLVWITEMKLNPEFSA